MKFNNKQNSSIISEDGTELWLSRSVAVTVCLIVIHRNQPYILTNQRGTGTPDYAGYWNLVCGYLDYDETVQEAAIREVWEECGINAIELMNNSEVVYFDPPWDVTSSPRNAKQNVTTHHGLVAKVNQLPPVSNAYNEPNETSDIRWLALEEVSKFEFAFNHQNRIQKFVQYIADRTEYNFLKNLEG